MSENFWRLPTSRINKKRTGSFSIIQKRHCSFCLFILLKHAIHIGILWFIDFGKAVDFQGWEVLFEFFMIVIDEFSFGCNPGVILILTGISLGQQSIDTRIRDTVNNAEAE